MSEANEERQYIVVKHGHSDTLSERVSEAMDRGYTPWGDLFYNEDKCVYVQSMIKLRAVLKEA